MWIDSIQSRAASLTKGHAKVLLKKPLIDPYGQTIHLGRGPFLVGISARQIALKGDVLDVSYKSAVDRSDPFNPVWEIRSISFALDS